MKTYYNQKQHRHIQLTERVWTGYCWLTPESTTEQIKASDKFCINWDATTTDEEKAKYH
jgi:hypothetical protein